MSGRSEAVVIPGRPAAVGPAVHVLRAAALLFLVYHASRHFEQFVSLPLLVALTGTAFLFALVAAAGSLRLVPALLLGAAFPPLLRFLVFLAFEAVRAVEPGPLADSLFAFFDRTFYPALLPFLTAYAFTVLAARIRAFLPWEIAANAVLLLLVFASERSFAFSLYGNTLSVAAVVLLFVILETAVLAADGARGGKGGKEALRFGVFAVPLLALLLFSLLGRFMGGQGAREAGLLKPTMLRFDFADYVNLESEIRMNREMIFLARVEGDPDLMLFKRYSLGGYSPRKGFFRTEVPGEEPGIDAVPAAAATLPDPGFSGREDLPQELYFLQFDPRSLISLEYPVEVAPIPGWEGSSFEGAYRVVSRRSVARPMDLYHAGPPEMSAERFAFYTDYGGNGEIRDLAEEITVGLSDYYIRVMAVYRFLRDNYRYSLRPGIAADGDQLRHFLFESRKGYCSYFAFSMVLLLRSIDIPARVAVGFYADPTQRVLDFYPVRSDMAHAWVEVPFGEYGWIEFDPTSRNVAPGEESSFGAAPPPESLSALLSEIGRNRDRALAVANTGPEADSPLPGGRAASPVGRFLILAALILFLPAASATAGALPWIRYRIGRNPRSRMRNLFRHALSRCVRAGYRMGRESPEEYALRLGRERGLLLVPVARSFQRSRFAPDYAAEDLARGEKAYRLFRTAFRRKVPLLLRFRSLLVPARLPRRFL